MNNQSVENKETNIIRYEEYQSYKICKNGVNGWCQKFEAPMDVYEYCSRAIKK